MTACSPRELLADGVVSLEDHLQPDGTLHDPVFRTPTQYGSAYYGWCCAVLAQHDSDLTATHRERAGTILVAALDHTSDPSLEAHGAGFDRRTLTVRSRLNHRDFTWPPILRTYLALDRLEAGLDRSALRRKIAAVDVEKSFRSRPPSNWSSVWMSGEWLRMQEDLSPTSLEEFDGWIDTFFRGDGTSGFDLGAGMFVEKGLPNAYDLFTRAHITDLLLDGYDGRNRGRLEAFLTDGLRRSLIMQLSDGSMASGYRSTAQAWVLGAQIALFTGTRLLGLGTESEREEAHLAAWRAFDALTRCARPDGVFSPVQNTLDPRLRVGYEGYTADGHYSPLALSFLASAVATGFGTDCRPPPEELDARPTRAFAEGAPTHRGVVHRGRISVGVQTETDRVYDSTGLVDLTFGAGRSLQFVTAARHLGGGPWLNPGMGVRSGSGTSLVQSVCGREHEVITPLTATDDGLAVETRVLPTDAEPGDDQLDGRTYRFEVTATEAGVEVTESLSGPESHVSLSIPYPRDLGGKETTAITFTEQGVVFSLGEERVEFCVQGAIEGSSDLPYGYENRRALCGLVRLDLHVPATELRWSVISTP